MTGKLENRVALIPAGGSGIGAATAHGRLDVMSNSAGQADVAYLEDTTLESWNRVMAVTLTSTLLDMNYCLPIMRQQGKGAIVNTSSIRR